MFLFRKPSTEFLREFVTTQQQSPYSYSEVGATKEQPPATYTVDHNRIKLGNGSETFNRAVDALKAWKQFELGWVRAFPADAPIESGTIVAILVRHFGFWSLNVVRLRSRINEALKLNRDVAHAVSLRLKQHAVLG